MEKTLVGNYASKFHREYSKSDVPAGVHNAYIVGFDCWRKWPTKYKSGAFAVIATQTLVANHPISIDIPVLTVDHGTPDTMTGAKALGKASSHSAKLILAEECSVRCKCKAPVAPRPASGAV